MTLERIDTQSGDIVLSDHIFELPSEGQVDEQYKAIMQFQQAVRSNLKEGLSRDYGTIPGTKKPTLLKPGAEKIMRLARVACQYTILNQVEDWDRPLFSYTVKCHVRIGPGGPIIEEGLGECNTLEAKYENSNAYSMKNTMLKMAKKRALVDAALAIGRLSDLFTQDIDDDPKAFVAKKESADEYPYTNKYGDEVHGFCDEHQKEWKRTQNQIKNNIKTPNHFLRDGEYCNMPKETPSAAPVPQEMTRAELEKKCKAQKWNLKDLEEALGTTLDDFLNNDGTPFTAWQNICSYKQRPDLM